VYQRRSGEFDTRERESPGEEPLLVIRNAIAAETPKNDEESRIAETTGKSEAELAGIRRNCCAGRATRNESVGTHEGAGVAVSAEEPRWCAD